MNLKELSEKDLDLVKMEIYLDGRVHSSVMISPSQAIKILNYSEKVIHEDIAIL